MSPWCGCTRNALSVAVLMDSRSVGEAARGAAAEAEDDGDAPIDSTSRAEA